MSFYTGLVADLYRPLRSGNPDPEVYERFITKHGEPALELGCGSLEHEDEGRFFPPQT